MSIIERIANWIERKKEKIVTGRYYKIHEKIFSTGTITELACFEDVIEAFYFDWVGYVDETFLVNLCTTLSKSLYKRNKILATEKLSRA